MGACVSSDTNRTRDATAEEIAFWTEVIDKIEAEQTKLNPKAV